MKIGIFLGGSSREREISFAGGRTVYDNLDKNLFTPIPIFVDSYGNFIRLDWEWLYKGTIRDFFPPARLVPSSESDFQVYLEQIEEEGGALVNKAGKAVGTRLRPDELKEEIDFAFLALHGKMGEDGTLQGLLEWLGIPYSGTGILGSAVGLNKLVQKNLMPGLNFPVSPYVVIYDFEITEKLPTLSAYIRQNIQYPCVVKSPIQGSSIGLSIVRHEADLLNAFDHALMRKKIVAADWNIFTDFEKNTFIRRISDIRESIGLPVKCEGQVDKIIRKPSELRQFLDEALAIHSEVMLQALDSGNSVLVEKFLEGQEFSVIVIEDEGGRPFALPPTGIIKSQDLFDYRSKYLPGMARKETPVNLPEEAIRNIMRQAERLMQELGFTVYARIDGYYQPDGTIFLNDPNTTSGMLPGSFFFHQAAEIGLDPSAFLTYIIHTSLRVRIREQVCTQLAERLILNLDQKLEQQKEKDDTRMPVAVVLGGYSSERHISVESGRNIYEKLSSSKEYAPVPLFLMKVQGDKALEPGTEYALWKLPINMLLKDNADDIRDKILYLQSNPSIHPVIQEIRNRCQSITQKFSRNASSGLPELIHTQWLRDNIRFAFIALHGRPGEDGELQTVLEKYSIPYNGSGIASSRITIDKLATLSRLKAWGLSGADQKLIHKAEWIRDPGVMLQAIANDFGYPLIVKPSDDGCSSAVMKIKNPQSFELYTRAMFRTEANLGEELRLELGLQAAEEFPAKDYFLVESLQTSESDDIHFLEVTVGLLTHREKDGSLKYEVFEPSETLAGSEILSLEEKFLAGEGQNITPARFNSDPQHSARISRKVKRAIRDAAALLGIEGYARVDAFVRIKSDERVVVEFIEVNSLPGMTPATCIFHQCVLAGYTPFDFIDRIIQHGMGRYSFPIKTKG